MAGRGARKVKFAVHERLRADTLEVLDLPLCRVLLMNDSRFPWVILVPRRTAAREIFDLSQPDREKLMREVVGCAAQLKVLTGAVKINVGALGNLVPQLHVHVVARRSDDEAWPGPVWGVGKAQPYTTRAGGALVKRLKRAFQKDKAAPVDGRRSRPRA